MQSQQNLNPNDQMPDPIPDVRSTGYSAPGVTPETQPRWQRWVLRWSQFVALVALFNLLLGLFNLSYLPLRDFYWQNIPSLVQVYDPVKGIEPHPDTQRYLETVDSLSEQVTHFGLRSPQVAEVLVDLRSQSDDLIDENPFLVARKFGAFAKLRSRIREQLKIDSAKDAFAAFWNQEYLTQIGWTGAIAFFDRDIRPLMATNYSHYTDENGQYVDHYWQIDLYFISFFALEFLGRTLILSRRQSCVSWGDVMLRRWYDGLLFLPVWRWLRIIPVTVRLHQSRLIHLDRLLAQVTHEPAAYLADRVAEFLLVRLVNQTKDAVEQGDLARMLFQPQDYIRVSDINKLDTISDRLLQITIYKVLPQVQPNLKVLLHHSLEESFKQFDVYRGLKHVPAIGALPAEVTEQLADYLAEALENALAATYTDEEGRQLFEQLSQDVKQALSRELQNEATQRELQTLLGELLEELKLNYIQRSKDYNAEATMAEVDELRQLTEAAEPAPSRNWET